MRSLPASIRILVAATAVAGCNLAFGVDDLGFDATGTTAAASGTGGGSGGGGSASCSDGKRNGDETGIDCGGSCPACMGPKPLGAACADPSECQSGQCPADDGVCCDTPCSLTCEACTTAKTGVGDGICDFVEAGTDPDAECTATEMFTCGVSGMGCLGTLTACALWPNGTQCGSPYCANGSEHGASLCDGSGDCDTPLGSPCSPYICGASACLTSCSDQNQCVSTHYCNGSSCEQKKANGAACSSDTADYECQCGDCTFALLCCA